MSMSSPYDAYSCMNTSSQEVARVIAPKISSAFSIMGSSHILKLVWGKWRTSKSGIDTYQRIMVGFSIFDILFSFFYWFLGTWMTPSDTGWWGAVGNTQTCSVQGFFSALLFGTAMYQMMLSLQMLLLVHFMWNPDEFAFRIERKMHFLNIIGVILIAVIPLFFDGYNPLCGTCLPVPTPYWCGDWFLGDGTTECIRGDATLANVYQYSFWVFISLITLFCSGSMIAIYLSVYLQERKMQKYRFNTDENDEVENAHSESERIRQALLLYISAFLICWIFPLILWYTPHSVPSLHIVGDVLFALMGFFNMLVFINPKCVKYQEAHPGSNILTCYFCIIFDNQINYGRRFITGIDRTPPTNFDATHIDDGMGESHMRLRWIRKTSFLVLAWGNPNAVSLWKVGNNDALHNGYTSVTTSNNRGVRRFITGTDRTPPTNLDATHIDDGMGESHMRRSVDSQNIIFGSSKGESHMRHSVDSQNIIFDSCIASPSNANEIAEEEAGGSLAEEGEDAPPTRLNHTQEVNADPPPTTRASYPIAVSLWKVGNNDALQNGYTSVTTSNNRGTSL
eukprot:CAMPEP_0201901710 /NCGR_PEP_ID=MMETSP0902-20130614/54572_1 /ASSEMBLY_ACC=CAM_ASM_000551 /TAXON_ID=420261 /ORGANISM="Thalassiosira antarctica, Strain CCMP982" /LENGTH=564 /DNA_ID=CAMNT_0048435681 /DNA_START=125 /DNA_END=1820 /DNA_ORIENTATION=+